MDYEVDIRCAGTCLTLDYFRTISNAKIYIKKYNPFVQGVNDDVVANIKEHGLSFSIWNKNGKCVYEADRDYYNDGTYAVTTVVTK